jgi:TolB-like protein/class 3 adenylate cyclase
VAEERVERRLAAILAGDVVGYSRLMGIDEEGTLRDLKELRATFLHPKVAEHRGRIVKTTGDGVLIEFPSVVDAVRFAVDVQRGMAVRNADIPIERRIELRMGINLGDIIIDSDDIYGDGVNVAARLEALAEPGGICVSRVVRDQVRDKLDVNFVDLGEQSVKNIARPVRVFRVDTGIEEEAAVSSITAEAPTLAISERPSIAVLPFQNMSNDPEQEYFVDGIVEDIITGLSRIKWLFVIARNSTFTYKGRAVDVKQVARELGVRYVLEGSLRKSGNRLRVTGQLIEASTGTHVWAERYDRALDDIFELQDDITLIVIGAIEPNLRQAEIERVKRKRPEHLDAYDLVLRALPLAVSGMPAAALNALPLLERALALEPNYSLAHGYVAWCHENLFVRAGRRDENRQLAIHHAHAALAHGRDDAMALTLAGFSIGMVEHDRTVAREAFEAAVSLSPSSALTYIYGGVARGFGGEAERAIEWGEKALRLSPFDPWNWMSWHAVYLGYFQRGAYEEAANAMRRSIQCNPGFSISYMFLAGVLARLGQIDEARTAAARVLALQPGFGSGEWRAAIDPVPAIGEPLLEGLRLAGLPE